MNRQTIENLGYKEHNSYTHGGFKCIRYIKGGIAIELDFTNNTFLGCSVNLYNKVWCAVRTIEELEVLDRIFTRNN